MGRNGDGWFVGQRCGNMAVLKANNCIWLSGLQVGPFGCERGFEGMWIVCGPSSGQSKCAGKV